MSNAENIPPVPSSFSSVTIPPNPAPGEGWTAMRDRRLPPNFDGGEFTLSSTVTAYNGFVNDYCEMNVIKKDKELLPKLIQAFKGTAAEWAKEVPDLANKSLKEFIKAIRAEFCRPEAADEAIADLNALKMSDFSSARAFFKAFREKRDEVIESGKELDDDRAIAIASAALDRLLVRRLSKDDTKAKLSALTKFRLWSAAVSKIDDDMRQDTADSVELFQKALASSNTANAATASKRPLPSSDANSKKPRDSTYVAAAGNTSFSSTSSSSKPQPFKLPAHLFKEQGTYAHMRFVAKLVVSPFNERGNIVAHGGCERCRALFVFHTGRDCKTWPDAKTYIVADDARIANVLAALTPAQRAIYDNWYATNKDEIARRSEIPAPRPSTNSKTIAAATGPSQANGVVMDYDDEEFVDSDDDIAARNPLLTPVRVPRRPIQTPSSWGGISFGNA